MARFSVVLVVLATQPLNEAVYMLVWSTFCTPSEAMSQSARLFTENGLGGYACVSEGGLSRDITTEAQTLLLGVGVVLPLAFGILLAFTGAAAVYGRPLSRRLLPGTSKSTGRRAARCRRKRSRSSIWCSNRWAR